MELKKRKSLTAFALLSTFALSSLVGPGSAFAEGNSPQENYHININATTEDTKRPIEFNAERFNFKLVGQTDLREYTPTAFSKNRVTFTNMPRQRYKVIFQTPQNFAVRPDKVSAMIPQNTPTGLMIFKSGDILDQNSGQTADLHAYMGIYEDIHTPFIESVDERNGRLEGRVFLSKTERTPEPSGTKIRVMSEEKRLLGEGVTKTDGTFDIRLDTNNYDYRNTRYYIVEATDPFGHKSVYDYNVRTTNRDYRDYYTNELRINDIREGDRYVEGRGDGDTTIRIYRNKSHLGTVRTERNGDFKLYVTEARYNDEYEFIMERRNSKDISIIKRVGDYRSNWNPVGKTVYYDGNRRYYYDDRGERIYEDINYNNSTTSNGYYTYDKYGNRVYVTGSSTTNISNIRWQRDYQGRDFFDQGTTRYFREGDRVYYEKDGRRYYVTNFNPVVLQNHTYTPNTSTSPSYNITGQNLYNQGVTQKTFPYRGPYIGGFSDGTFRPNKGITRAELATFLYRIGGQNDAYQKQAFYDTGNHWARTAIKWASNANVMNGFGDGTFRPDQVVSRAELVATLAKFQGTGSYTQHQATKFYDVPANHWASGVIKYYSDQGILAGFGDGSFKPDKMVTRAEAVATINKIVKRSGGQTGAKVYFRDVPQHHWAYQAIMQATS